jgi:hypothetical protein
LTQSNQYGIATFEHAGIAPGAGKLPGFLLWGMSMKSKSKGNANKEYHARKVPGGMDKPKLGGGVKKGDSRSKSMLGPIKPQKSC